MAHPAGDRWIPLGLRDQVAQQGVGAKESQPDVGSLGEVLQHRRVGEPLSAWPAVDKRHHNLDKHAFNSQEEGLRLRAKDLVVPLRSPRGRCASSLWYRAGRRHVIYGRWAASQTVQCTHALNLGEKRKTNLKFEIAPSSILKKSMCLSLQPCGKLTKDHIKQDRTGD